MANLKYFCNFFLLFNILNKTILIYKIPYSLTNYKSLMNIKKLFYKFTNKEKYKKLKTDLLIKKKIKVLKSGFEQEIININDKLKKKEISFLHSGHLGDVINALPIIKEISKNSKCNLYLRTGKKLEQDAYGYKFKGDNIYMISYGEYGFAIIKWYFLIC